MYACVCVYVHTHTPACEVLGFEPRGRDEHSDIDTDT